MTIYRYTGFINSTIAAKNIGISRQAILKAIKQNRIDAYKLGEGNDPAKFYT